MRNVEKEPANSFGGSCFGLVSSFLIASSTPSVPSGTTLIVSPPFLSPVVSCDNEMEGKKKKEIKRIRITPKAGVIDCLIGTVDN